jgi:hypothetical protein
MVSFLLWNINKKPLHELIYRLSCEYDVDVFMLIESDIPPDEMVQTLNKHGSRSKYHYLPGLCEKVWIYSRFSERYIQPISEEERLTIRNVKLPGLVSFLLVVMHFPSKLHMSDDSQAMLSGKIIREIESTENVVGHSRTIVVGDFNMNPFETGVISAGGLNSVMTRQIAERRSRTVQNKKYQFFYNPMWNHFGEDTPGPPGTYYYSGSEPKNYYWNMFDQVLIRPDLMDRFNNRQLCIVHSIGGESLLTSGGLPNRRKASDHLPIKFVLDL